MKLKFTAAKAGMLALILLIILLCLLLLYHAEPKPQGRWVENDGVISYQNTDNILLTGWQEIDGIRYFFLSDGALATGWQTPDGSQMYFDHDGKIAEGWRDIDGEKYWFSDGIPCAGWQEIDGQNRYFHEDGTLAKGFTEIEGNKYLFSEDGSMFTGFVQLDEKRYLFLSDGTLASGWVEYLGFRYFAQEDGNLYTGWMQDGEYDLYFHPDGAMAVGETFVDGRQLYFTPNGVHVTLVNPWHTMPVDYRVNPVSVDGTYFVDSSCYDALIAMMAACEEAGHIPMICSGYRTQAEQEWLYQRKVNYYLEEGLEEDNARALAGKSVAVPGTSEHQLGLAVDIVSTDYYVLDESQATTKTQQWLMEHCWEYGFILRYPVDKSEITGIIYEPWHYRYVGVEVALALRDSGLCLEEYLGAVTGENA